MKDGDGGVVVRVAVEERVRKKEGGWQGAAADN